MTTDVKIDLEENSPYRVAFDLARQITFDEKHGLREKDPRTYWLNLYAQCRRVVFKGYNAEQAIKETGQ